MNETEYIKDQLESIIAETLADDSVVINYTAEANEEMIYSDRERQAVGAQLHPQQTLEAKTPTTTVTVTMSEDTQITTFAHEDTTDSDDRITIGHDEIESTECPSCLTDFSLDTWEYTGGEGYRSGARSVYECPDEDCEEEIVLYS